MSLKINKLVFPLLNLCLFDLERHHGKGYYIDKLAVLEIAKLATSWCEVDPPYLLSREGTCCEHLGAFGCGSRIQVRLADSMELNMQSLWGWDLTGEGDLQC